MILVAVTREKSNVIGYVINRYQTHLKRSVVNNKGMGTKSGG
jgi:hypothetical protein